MKKFFAKNKISTVLILPILVAILIFSHARFVFADRIEELQQQLDEKTQQMKPIEEEIKKLTEELNKTLGEKSTLSSQIKSLELTRKKLNTDISLTQKKIELSNLNINQLEGQIQEKTSAMELSRLSLAETVRNLNEADSSGILALILSKDNFSDFFNDVESLQNVQARIGDNLEELKLIKDELGIKKDGASKEKEKLQGLKSNYLDKKTLVEIDKSETNKLLSETKNKESNYKKLIEDKERLRAEFEQELANIESQIKIEIDPNSIPAMASGVLRWPFTDERMEECKTYTKALGNPYCITQYFGITSFAKANRNGKPHQALDFRSPVGTALVASEDGIILGQGDTDKTCRNASYGKWVLIKHNNGLSTLYAHMSLIKVTSGQTVTKGQIIGYSGNTGSSTGPHLHYSVIASQGVSIAKVPSKVCGKEYTIPVASTNSYLNPASYL